MAEDKKAFVVYCDLINTVSKLPNEKAGELFKFILEYVNDRDPQTDDLLLQVLFEPIKLQMERDFIKWQSKSTLRSAAGKIGGLKSGETRRKQKEAFASFDTNNEANEAVTDTVTVTETIKEEVKKPSKEVLTLPFNSERFLTTWKLLLKEKNWKSKTNYAYSLSLKRIAKYPESTAISIIEETIENGWKKFVLPEEKFCNNKTNTVHPTTAIKPKIINYDHING